MLLPSTRLGFWRGTKPIFRFEISGSAAVNEGDSVTITVKTTNVKDGTVFNWEVGLQGTTDAADFLDPLSGQATVSGSMFSVTLAINADEATEGDEYFTFILKDLNNVTIATSQQILINDTSQTPVGPPPPGPRPQFDNGDFSSGLDNWVVVNEKINVGGVSTGVGTLASCPVPADPTPNPYGSFGQGASFSGGYTVNITSPGYDGTGSCATLTTTGGNSDSYAQIYGPALVSANPVIAAEGDTISFWWTATGGGDAFNVLGYIVDPDQECRIFYLIDETGSSGSATKPWNKVEKLIGPGEAGNYFFVFICGAFDFSGGRYLGARLSIDEIKIEKASAG